MKIRFGDGITIECLDNENKSREDVITEARKVHKKFKDTAKTITVQCYIIDDNNILIQDRKSDVWHGLAVPGGHVKSNETPEQGCIREVKEETGLDVSGLVLFGTNEYTDEEDGECIALLYKTSTFSGTPKGSEEGEVKWMKIDDVFNSDNCAEGFKSLLSKCCQTLKKDSEPIKDTKLFVLYPDTVYKTTETYFSIVVHISGIEENDIYDFGNKALDLIDEQLIDYECNGGKSVDYDGEGNEYLVFLDYTYKWDNCTFKELQDFQRNLTSNISEDKILEILKSINSEYSYYYDGCSIDEKTKVDEEDYNKKEETRKKPLKDGWRVEGQYYPETRYEPAEYPEVIIESDYSGDEIQDNNRIYSIDSGENFGTLDEILNDEFELVKDKAELEKACETLDDVEFEDVDNYDIYKCKEKVTTNDNVDYDEGSYFTYEDVEGMFSYDTTKLIQGYYDDYKDWQRNSRYGYYEKD